MITNLRERNKREETQLPCPGLAQRATVIDRETSGGAWVISTAALISGSSSAKGHQRALLMWYLSWRGLLPLFKRHPPVLSRGWLSLTAHQSLLILPACVVWSASRCPHSARRKSWFYDVLISSQASNMDGIVYSQPGAAATARNYGMRR